MKKKLIVRKRGRDVCKYGYIFKLKNIIILFFVMVLMNWFKLFLFYFCIYKYGFINMNVEGIILIVDKLIL